MSTVAAGPHGNGKVGDDITAHLLAHSFPSNAVTTTPAQHLVQSVRSDDLPKLAVALRQISAFKHMAEVFQVDLILDANVVIADLVWLARTRTNRDARTALMEVMACGVVRAHAPSFLVREINVNLPEVAKDLELDERELRRIWREYRKNIRFVPVGGPARGKGAVDPKDWPYVRLQRKLSYPVVSKDHHIAAMGGRVVRVQVFGALKAYSRQAAVEYQFKVAGAGATILLSAMVEGGVALAKNLTEIPKTVRWAGLILLGALMAHPTSRRKLLELGAELCSGGIAAMETLFGVVAPMLEEHHAAQQAARVGLAKARSELSKEDAG